jgi:hypothetical protein
MCDIFGVSVQLLSETNRNGRPRWLRVNQLPFSRAIAYKLINSGAIASVLLRLPDSRKGMRLVDSDSLDRFLEGLATNQLNQKKEATAV